MWKPSSILTFLNRTGIHRAFTLLEMLLAMCVLAVVLVLAAQMVNTTSLITRRCARSMNLDNCARNVFDRMSLDFSALLQRKDIDSYFHKEPGNDRMAFYSQASGFYPVGVSGIAPASPYSLVAYRIDNNRLERLGKGLVWNGVTDSSPHAKGLSDDDSAMVFLPKKITDQWNIFATGTAGDPDYQVLSSQVFRLELCFMQNDGSFSTGFDSKLSMAVIVTIAVLDQQNAMPVPDLESLASRLPDGDDPGVADLWVSTLDALASTRGGARREIRVYQRFFQLQALP